VNGISVKFVKGESPPDAKEEAVTAKL